MPWCRAWPERAMNIVKMMTIGFAVLLAASAEAADIAVKDALGREVRFVEPPARIVIAGKASFMIADAVSLFPGARARTTVFAAGAASRQGADDFLELVMPGGAASTPMNGDAGAEQIAAAKPDVVLLKSSSRRLGDVLERLHIPVVYLDFETTAQYSRDLAILGRVLNDEERARLLMTYYDGLRSSVSDRTASIPATKKPRTLLLQYSERGGVIAFSVPPPEWIQTELVELAGGTPIWKDAAQHGGWTIVNLEQIAAWDPDVVLVVSYSAAAEKAVAAITADAAWQALRAAWEKRVFAFPGDFRSWDQPDTRWILGLLWTATRLHPERFKDTDLTREIARFYSLYGLDEATVQSRVIPLIRENIR